MRLGKKKLKQNQTERKKNGQNRQDEQNGQRVKKTNQFGQERGGNRTSFD